MTSPNAPLIQNVPTVIRRNTVGRVSIELVDSNNNPVDASVLQLAVSCNGSDCAQYTEDFFQTLVLPRSHRIIKPSGTTGIYYIDWGDVYYPAVLTGTGGSYPTGFAGGEFVTIMVDSTPARVIFQAGDQSLAQVIARINGTFGPLLGQLLAADNGDGQLQLTGVRTGQGGLIQVTASSLGVATALGLAPPNNTAQGSGRFGETDGTADWLFDWTTADALHPSDVQHVFQTVYVLPGAMFQMLPKLRLQIDKAVKLVNNAQGVFLGYTDAQLLQYLLGGLQTINGYQPAVFFSPDNFPYQLFGSVLIEAAMLWGVMSQTLFAVDTDVPSYSDQGASFTISHQGPLANYLSSVANRLDRNIPLFKLHFVRTGTSVTEMGANFRLQSLLDAAPSGALFRNLYFKP